MSSVSQCSLFQGSLYGAESRLRGLFLHMDGLSLLSLATPQVLSVGLVSNWAFMASIPQIFFFIYSVISLATLGHSIVIMNDLRSSNPNFLKSFCFHYFQEKAKLAPALLDSFPEVDTRALSEARTSTMTPQGCSICRAITTGHNDAV